MVKKNTKNGELAMRKLIIADDSGYKMECTLWRVFAETIEPSVGQIIVLKNVKVGEFNGKNVSTYEESVVILDPPYLKECESIKTFVENANGSFKTLSKEIKHDDTPKQTNVFFLKDVLELIDDTMNEDKYSHSKIKATVTQIIHNDKNYYGGCHDLNCKKKLQEDSHGYSCINCNKTYSKPNYYYTLSIRVKDCSNEYWIDMMGNIAEKFMRMTAEEYKDIVVSRNESRLREITNDLEFKTFFFFVRPKLHFYNSVPKKKLYVSRIETVDCIQDSARLIKKLGNKN
jgi:replication factor A1